MNWIKRFAKGLAVVVVSLMIAVVASELLLRGIGRYTHVADIEIGGNNKIWERFPSYTYTGRRHPDTGQLLEIKFNSFGARASSESDNRIGDVNVGVFGDSFTENIRLEQEFTFVSILNELSDGARFHNFGVEGYGIEQSFQQWLDKRNLIDMDVVLYLFCQNDLQDTYTAQIFDKEKMHDGKVENIASLNIPLHIRLLSKFHLTYLLLEGFNKAKSVLSPERTTYTLETYLNRVGQEFSEVREKRESRRDEQYRHEIFDDYLSGSPSGQSLETAKHFQNTLRTWKRMVEDQGGQFFLAVLPRESEILLSGKLIPNDFDRILLSTNDEIELLNGYPWRFENNGHWNEYGNLSGAISLNRALINSNNAPFLREIDENYIAEKINRIDEYYRSQ